MKTVTAAKRLGEALTVLEAAGVTNFMCAMDAIMAATPDGGTPERKAALEAYKPSEN